MISITIMRIISIVFYYKSKAPYSWGFLFVGWLLDLVMRRFLVLLCLVGILKAYDATYISPGIQVGMNSIGNLFISGQITFGLVPFDVLDLDISGLPSSSKAIPIGLTIGERHYKVKGEGWKKYHYIDAQAWIGYAGLGLGLMVDENRNKYSRFKCGAGLFGYLTYDYFKVFKHNYGLIGVRPRVNKFLN